MQSPPPPASSERAGDIVILELITPYSFDNSISVGLSLASSANSLPPPSRVVPYHFTRPELSGPALKLNLPLNCKFVSPSAKAGPTKYKIGKLVELGLLVTVFEGVLLGVILLVGVLVGEHVGELLGVLVGVLEGVLVLVGVLVAVRVGVAVLVGVTVFVGVQEEDAVGVLVLVVQI